MCQLPLNPARSNQSQKQPVLLPLHEPLGFNACSSTRFCIYNSSRKEKDVMGMVRKPVMEPDAVRNNRESKTSVKVTLNTIISAGKEHTRYVEPDLQLVS